jgi:hypothetical protein
MITIVTRDLLHLSANASALHTVGTVAKIVIIVQIASARNVWKAYQNDILD